MKPSYPNQQVRVIDGMGEADRDLGFGFSAVIPAEQEGLGRFFLP